MTKPEKASNAAASMPTLPLNISLHQSSSSSISCLLLHARNAQQLQPPADSCAAVFVRSSSSILTVLHQKCIKSRKTFWKLKFEASSWGWIEFGPDYCT